MLAVTIKLDTWHNDSDKKVGGRAHMSYRSETPFDNVESSHEYVALLAEAVQEALVEVEADIALAAAEEAGRRKEALQIVHYKLTRLATNVASSSRILN